MIPVFKPFIGPEEIDASREALELGWLGMGSYVQHFEEAVQSYLGLSDRYVATTSTGHAALHLALITAGVGPGDEVITPSFNNIADLQAILAVGAEPVFCDIDNDTLAIDLHKAEQLIGPKTKALIVMDYDCLLADHDHVARIADAYGLRIIHDAAHSFGSRYKGKMVGSFSDICMFSFDPVKTITCIDGGALVVRSTEELDKIHQLRLIGMGQPVSVMYQNQRAWTYDVKMLGFRYHMSNLHAAIGLQQLKKMPEISVARRAACRAYNERLATVTEISVPQTDFDDITPFLYYIRVPAAHRNDFRSFLKARGVDTGIHWQPGHEFTLLKKCRRGDLSVTNRVGSEILSLPLHSGMSTKDIDHITSGVSDYWKPRATT